MRTPFRLAMPNWFNTLDRALVCPPADPLPLWRGALERALLRLSSPVTARRFAPLATSAAGAARDHGKRRQVRP